jgi:hypothetical protein
VVVTDNAETAMWREHRKKRQARRAARAARFNADRAAYPEVTIERQCSEHHYHLRVGAVVLDYWPATGKWRAVQDTGLVRVGGLATMVAWVRATT